MLDRLCSEFDMPLPLLQHKRYDAPSAFTPESLLREARRQKGLEVVAVPAVCVLDPDGDLVRRLRDDGRAQIDRSWACYHTELYRASVDGVQLGLLGCAVGAPFAVLVAEELFASGCRLLISITSAGQLVELRPPPYFVLIEKALRDEGASYHYMPASEFSEADPALLSLLDDGFDGIGIAVERGATWTTDAPFRETGEAIASMHKLGLLAVEMEAAALYAFACARAKAVVCFAHVTNQMGRIERDFAKGEADGSVSSLEIIRRTASILLPAVTPTGQVRE
jgi:uridine phosphorylase